MPVEFLGMGGTNDGTETHPRTGPIFDREYTFELARAHEHGWDRERDLAASEVEAAEPVLA